MHLFTFEVAWFRGEGTCPISDIHIEFAPSGFRVEWFFLPQGYSSKVSKIIIFCLSDGIDCVLDLIFQIAIFLNSWEASHRMRTVQYFDYWNQSTASVEVLQNFVNVFSLIRYHISLKKGRGPSFDPSLHCANFEWNSPHWFLKRYRQTNRQTDERQTIRGFALLSAL